VKYKLFRLNLVILTTVLITVFGLSEAFSQYKNESEASIPLEHFYIKRKGHGLLRPWLSKLHWGLSAGYGGTAFKHKLDGFGVIQQPDSMPQIFSDGNLTSRYTNWTNDVGTTSGSTQAGSFVVNSDTADLGFKSKMVSIPLKVTVHVEFNRYRIGGGYSFDYTRVGEFKPLNYAGDIKSYSLDKQSFFMKHYFGMIGAMVYRYYEYALVVDANIGGYKLGKQFNKSLMQKGIYFNVGATVEREFSEYFRVFVRPSYEIKNYKLTMPESSNAVTHRLNAFYVNVGVTYRLPELRRCFLKSCKAQMNHAHGDKEYRSRVHPFYKKQNPHYGENYPTLIKYKGKNKNKLNPY
jgi:hypothetical protein